MNRRTVTQILETSDKVHRIPRRPDEPLKDFPLYTIPEAAIYLAIPERTLRYWVLDHPVWRVSGREFKTPLLSFRDVAQAYYVEIVRKYFGLTLPKTREVLEMAKLESRSRYPLLKPNIKLFFKQILMDKPARKSQPRRVIDLTQHRQLAIGEIIDHFSTRVRWNLRGEPTQIFPWRYWNVGDETRPVSIDPDVMSGRLVITGTRIPVQTIMQRKESGEDIPRISSDYHLPQVVVEQALRHLVPQAA